MENKLKETDMNYKVTVGNYIEHGIELTYEGKGEYDCIMGGYEVFESFGKAKEYYLKVMRNERNHWSSCISNALKLTKSQIT